MSINTHSCTSPTRLKFVARRQLDDDDDARATVSGFHGISAQGQISGVTLPRTAAYLSSKWQLPTVVTKVRTAEESSLFVGLLELYGHLLWVKKKNGVVMDITRLTSMFNAQVLMDITHNPESANRLFLKSERYITLHFNRLLATLAARDRLELVQPELRDMQRSHNRPLDDITPPALPPGSISGLPQAQQASEPSGHPPLNFAKETMQPDPNQPPPPSRKRKQKETDPEKVQAPTCSLCGMVNKFKTEDTGLRHTRKDGSFFCPVLQAFVVNWRSVSSTQTKLESCKKGCTGEVQYVGRRVVANVGELREFRCGECLSLWMRPPRAASKPKGSARGAQEQHSGVLPTSC